MRRPDPLKNLDRELARFHGRLKAGAVFVALLATVLLALYGVTKASFLSITSGWWRFKLRPAFKVNLPPSSKYIEQ